MCHPSSSVFMTNNMLTSAKKHRESTKPQSRQRAMFFFFRWANSKLRDSFLTVFTQNSSISYWAVNQPIAFSQLWSHTRWFKLALKSYASLAMPFSKIVCMRTNTLAMKQLLFKIVELEIWLHAWRQGESLASTVESMFEESLHGQWFFSQYCIHLLRKPTRTDLLLCDRWQTSAQACTCC